MTAIPRRSITILLGFVFCSTAIAVIQNVWYWQQLPARVATHFGVDGEPNVWMSRNAATALMLALQVGLPLFMAGLGAGMGWIPASLVNIPNRQYWFEPERRESTIRTLQLLLLFSALLTSLFLIWLSHLTFHANMTGGGLPLRDGLGGIVLYLVGVFATAGISLWRFRCPRRE
ncbi:MAG: DUF1648 domain-containing protein [Planctomycetales bacterium]|nr:DUF1648 domain-containing protein [Planctomycetales bacterium]